MSAEFELSSHVHTPPVRPRMMQIFEAYAAAVKAAFPDLACCFGLEMRTAWTLWVEAGAPDDSPLRPIFLRPCREPIIASYAPNFRAVGLTARAYADLGSALAGARERLRETPFARTTEFLGERLIYDRGICAAERLNVLLERINSLREGADFPDALEVYAALVLAQPLTNSNARTANAVLTLVLMRAGLICAPVLSLGPSFIAQPERSFQAWKSLGQGEWTPILAVIESALERQTEALKRCG